MRPYDDNHLALAWAILKDLSDRAGVPEWLGSESEYAAQTVAKDIATRVAAIVRIRARGEAAMSKQTEMHSTFKDYGFSPSQRKKLEVWGEEEGHCSACQRDCVDVAHIGLKKKAHVGLCRECVTRLHAALPTGSASDG